MTGSVHEITPFFKFTLPEFDVNTWHDAIWQNFRLIDSVLGNVYNISQFVGLWDNSIELKVNDKVIDGLTGNIYVVTVDHTTPAAPTTFAEWFALYPSYYLIYEPVQAAMAWATGSGTIAIASGSYSYSARAFAIGTDIDFTSTDWNSVDVNGFYNKRSAYYYSYQSYLDRVSASNSASTATTAKNNASASATSAGAYATNAQTYMLNAQSAANSALTASTNINVSVDINTPTVYRLNITQANGSTFITPNMIGPKGDAGQSMNPLAQYDTLVDLQTAHPSPTAGDCYAVGLTSPYDIYIYDGDNLIWVNHGTIQGPSGADGADGFSPTVVVKTNTATDYILTVTDNNGSYDTPNLKGANGANGTDGLDGTDGIDASVSVATNTEDSYTLSVTSASGTITTPNLKGDRNPLYTPLTTASTGTGVIVLDNTKGLYYREVSSDITFSFNTTGVSSGQVLTFELMVRKTAGSITFPTNVDFGDAGDPVTTDNATYTFTFRYLPSIGSVAAKWFGVYGGKFTNA